MDDSDKKIFAFVAILFLIIFAYGGFRIVKGKLAEDDAPEIVVERGDVVIMNYTGRLANPSVYGQDILAVFDTSEGSVADDNSTANLKAASYAWRNNIQPFSFTVGEGQVIQGWEINVLGMKEGETQTWNIPPEQAYNPRLEELNVTYERVETCPVYETMLIEDFAAQYAGIAQIPDTPGTHTYWGWDFTVHLVTGTEITIFNAPAVGGTYSTGYGWDTKATSIDQASNGGEGVITMTHQPVVGDLAPMEMAFDTNMSELKTLRDGNQRPGEGVINEVNANTFVVDYNSETYGVELIFTVNLISIKKA